MNRVVDTAVVAAAVSVGVLFGAPCPAGPPSDAPPPARKERGQFQAACVALVRACDGELAEQVKLLRAGAATEGEVDVVRLALAGARQELALVEGRPAAAVEQSRALVAIRERELDRLLKLPGRGDVGAVEALAARRQVANARRWLAREERSPGGAARHLREVIELCDAEVRALQTLARRGIAVPEEVDAGRRRLAYARYRLAREEGRAEGAAEQLRITVQLREQDLKRTRQVDDGTAEAAQDVDWHHVLLLEARQRQAVFAGDAPAAREHLGRRLAVLERMSRRQREVLPADRVLRASLEYQLALVRYQLALASEGVPLVDGDPLYELDY